MTEPMRVSALYVHPVKSCAGLRVDELALDAMGAAGDRRFMLVDAHGKFVTQREHARLALVRVARAADGVVLSAAGRGALAVPAPNEREGEREAIVWRDRVRVRDCGDAAADWLSTMIDTPVRLVHLPDDSVRAVDPAYAPSGTRTNLADGFPLLVATDSSLADLARRAAMALPMERFRPNVVIAGSDAWEEDRWESLRIGGITLHLVKPCARCAITIVDPDTADVGLEPLRALAGFRRGANLGYGGADAGKTYFAWNALHERVGALRVGDVVEVVAHRS